MHFSVAASLFHLAATFDNADQDRYGPDHGNAWLDDVDDGDEGNAAALLLLGAGSQALDEPSERASKHAPC